MKLHEWQIPPNVAGEVLRLQLEFESYERCLMAYQSAGEREIWRAAWVKAKLELQARVEAVWRTYGDARIPMKGAPAIDYFTNIVRIEEKEKEEKTCKWGPFTLRWSRSC